MRGSSAPVLAPKATETGQRGEEFLGRARVASRHCPDIRELARAGQHCPDIRESPGSQPSELRLLDGELHRLARGAGRLRLRIGQGLHRLGGGFQELGFSTLGAYALERCSRGGRWAAESRALARRLQSLPQLAEALETGSVGWSMA